MFENLKNIWKKSLALSDPQKLTVPAGMPGGPTAISLEGRSYIEVDGCEGLTVYEEEVICMRIKEGMLKIQGQDLSLKIYYGKRIAVCGRIERVEFEEKKQREDQR